MLDKFHSPHKYLFWGLVLVLGGAVWRLSLMGFFELSWRFALPAVLIILGLALLISGFIRQRPWQSPEPPGGQP